MKNVDFAIKHVDLHQATQLRWSTHLISFSLSLFAGLLLNNYWACVWRVCVAFLVNLLFPLRLTWDPMKHLCVIVRLDWSDEFLSHPLTGMIALNDIKFGLGILNLALRWWMTFRTCRVQQWWQSQRKWASLPMPLKASASSIFTRLVLQPSLNSQGLFFLSLHHISFSNIRRGLIPEFQMLLVLHFSWAGWCDAW